MQMKLISLFLIFQTEITAGQRVALYFQLCSLIFQQLQAWVVLVPSFAVLIIKRKLWLLLAWRNRLWNLVGKSCTPLKLDFRKPLQHAWSHLNAGMESRKHPFPRDGEGNTFSLERPQLGMLLPLPSCK